jgi:nitrate reductase cytochrome c-type subunit
MKMFFRLLVVVSLTAVMALPLAAIADEPENVEADAKSAEGEPPVIPHRIADNASGEDCLACHRAGLNGAPQTPHPMRINCTQCHVRSDLGDPEKAAEKKKKSKVAK